MVSWTLTLWLMLLSALLPMVYHYYRRKALRAHSRAADRKLQYLRRRCEELEGHVQHDKALFLEALGTPFLLMRPSGRVVMSNQAAEQLLGLQHGGNVNLLHTLPQGELHSLLQRAVSAEKRCEQTLTREQYGRPRVYRVTATPLGNADSHIGIVFHDITEMQRTQAIRREFVANASHELRTPLTIIRGYLENLLEEPEMAADEAQRTRALELMRKHSDRIVRLVEDMLTISRLEAGDTGYLKQDDFELTECIGEVQQRLEPMARAQGAELRLQLEPQTLHGDRFYWAQVFFNLVENALKNNPTPGLIITVSAARQADGSLRMAVEDNGVGIAPEALPFIFNRFYRADKTGRVKGTGLGLAIVRHAVEAHGGRIRAESEPGVRTAFIIDLPKNERR